VMLPIIFAALWLGIWGWALLVTILSVYGFKEFARATGLYRERLFVLVVYAAMVAANVAAYFGRFGLFMVAPVWAVGALTLVPIIRNRTEGMLQNFALSVVGIVYFGWFLAHLTYLAIWTGGLGLVLYVVLATQLNDVIALPSSSASCWAADIGRSCRPTRRSRARSERSPSAWLSRS